MPGKQFFATMEKNRDTCTSRKGYVMKLEILSERELETLYRQRVREDFPPDELRPFSSMQYLLKQNAYRCYVYREDGEIRAYAMLILSHGVALLDYFAVAPHCRGQGVGSRFLRELKNSSREFQVPYVLIEAESEESAETPEQLTERQRRFRFYNNCGCILTPVFSFLFGVEYQILLLPLGDALPDSETVRKTLEDLYRVIISHFTGDDEAAFKKVCKCYLKPDPAEYNLLTLELLNPENEVQVKKIQRDDVPGRFAEDISYTVELAKYGDENHLRGHCYCIKYREKYIGILLIGEAIEDEADPAELKGKGYFRIIGFVLDRDYRGKGLGSTALELALEEIYREYGKVPILLECHKDNTRAANFYTKMGFRNTNILNNEDYFFIKD